MYIPVRHNPKRRPFSCKNKEKRMAKSGSENTGNATNFSGCPPCKKTHGLS